MHGLVLCHDSYSQKKNITNNKYNVHSLHLNFTLIVLEQFAQLRTI